MANIPLNDNPIISNSVFVNENYKVVSTKDDNQDAIIQSSSMVDLFNNIYDSEIIYKLNAPVRYKNPIDNQWYSFRSLVDGNIGNLPLDSAGAININWDRLETTRVYTLDDQLDVLTNITPAVLKEQVIQISGTPPTSENYRVPSVKYMKDQINASTAVPVITFTINIPAAADLPNGTWDFRNNFLKTSPAPGFYKFKSLVSGDNSTQAKISNYPDLSFNTTTFNTPSSADGGNRMGTVLVKIASYTEYSALHCEWNEFQDENISGEWNVNGKNQIFTTTFNPDATHTLPLFWNTLMATKTSKLLNVVSAITGDTDFTIPTLYAADSKGYLYTDTAGNITVHIDIGTRIRSYTIDISRLATTNILINGDLRFSENVKVDNEDNTSYLILEIVVNIGLSNVNTVQITTETLILDSVPSPFNYTVSTTLNKLIMNQF